MQFLGRTTSKLGQRASSYSVSKLVPLAARPFSTLPRAVTEITHPDDDVPQKTLDAVNRYNQHTITTYGRPNIVISKGKGSSLYDTNGREYIDFTAGIAVVALGHADPGVTKVLTEQASKLVHISNLYHNENAGELADKLINKTHDHGGAWANKVFLANSGTEANEAALKFARKWGKHVAGDDKYEIVCFTNAFHGRSMGALSATYNPKYQKPFAPLLPGFVTVPFNDVEKAVAAITDKTCGVIVEPIQGEGGVHDASQEFLEALRKRCDETNAVLIFDEIQCGLGRTGKLWGHQHFNCQPDILTLAKPLANGVPIGAALTNEKVGDMIKLGDHGTTFGGNPLATAVACHVFDRISDDAFLKMVREKGDALKSGLKAIQAKHPDLIKEIRGKGLLLGMEFTQDPAPLVKMARERGLLVVTASCNTLRVIPPLVLTEEEAEKGLARLAGAVEQFAQTVSSA
ncbi:pyridoxal phosphate-dependent transferase [Radiomyces spectabilis]|uniref:pyridoxal phosphate-dependent transferase n=1 Tax=Radiomyces spectabilis TaxID=64574 RepID=UPI00221F3827|nr:pyridoxal phosphate-dependent transferase [Radiomyces spectabilis]KAI8367695.1 pyridoxal phosphate-dependent transferase [Radiomyces spectabilis]